LHLLKGGRTTITKLFRLETALMIDSKKYPYRIHYTAGTLVGVAYFHANHKKNNRRSFDYAALRSG
jgi:hypothetical protein